MTNSVQPNSHQDRQIKALSWAGYVNVVSAGIEQARRVMKSGGLSQPEVARHLQSSRASAPARGEI